MNEPNYEEKRLKYNLYMCNYRKKNKKKINEQALKSYYKHREKIIKKHNIYQKENADKINKFNRENRKKIKLKVLNYYSNNNPKCICCNEIQIEFLCIDHINGNGNEHRKLIKHEWICTWIVRNNFPIGFQILCFNCNQSKGFYGYCPHKKQEGVSYVR